MLVLVHLLISLCCITISEGAMRVAWNGTALPKEESFVWVYEALFNAIQNPAQC